MTTTTKTMSKQVGPCISEIMVHTTNSIPWVQDAFEKTLADLAPEAFPTLYHLLEVLLSRIPKLSDRIAIARMLNNVYHPQIPCVLIFLVIHLLRDPPDVLDDAVMWYIKQYISTYTTTDVRARILWVWTRDSWDSFIELHMIASNHIELVPRFLCMYWFFSPDSQPTRASLRLCNLPTDDIVAGVPPEQ